jgi:choline dehydrogenase
MDSDNTISGGSITLATTSPFDPPLIDFGLLSSQLDASIALEGVRSVQRLFSSPPFSQSVFDVTIPKSNPNGTLTNEDILEYMSFQATQFGHGVGSCSMAPHGAEWGVVDPDFKVRGIKGLRIVDASVVVSSHIFFNIVSPHVFM